MRILFSIVFVLLATDYMQLSNASWIDLLTISILGIIIVINNNIIRSNLRKRQDILLLLIITFIILLIISFFRTNQLKSGVVYSLTKSLKVLMTFTATLSFLNINSEKTLFKNNDNYFFKVISIPIVFVLLNLIFKLISYDIFGFVKLSPELGVANTLYFISGFEIERLPFPLSNGINNYGSFLGGALVLSFSFFLTTKDKLLKSYSLIISIINLICLLLIDTRTALITFILISLSTTFFKVSKHLNISRKLVWLVGLLPLVLVLTGFLLKNVELFSFISRNDDNEVGSGNNRNIIWTFCLQEVLAYKPIHLIGFGEFGQVGSKISNLWAEDFALYDNAIYTSAHNTTLQLFLDIGYIGVFGYYSLLIVSSNYIYKMYKISKESYLIIFQNFLLYISFIGGTEAINSHSSTFYLFIIILGCIYSYNQYIKRVQ